MIRLLIMAFLFLLAAALPSCGLSIAPLPPAAPQSPLHHHYHHHPDLRVQKTGNRGILRGMKLLQGAASASAVEGEQQDDGRMMQRLDAGGPGSKPPRCASKCGKCTPCTPVRVPVQPGPHKTSEYYPEAWRCKCKGKLYMP